MLDDFPDNRCEPKRLDILKRMHPSASIAPSLLMAQHVQEFQQLYRHPADLISNSTGAVQNYQLLRGYLLGKGYSFAEIDAPDGLWPLIKTPTTTARAHQTFQPDQASSDYPRPD